MKFLITIFNKIIKTKKIIYIVLIIFVYSCSCPKKTYKEYKDYMGYRTKELLKKAKAEEKKYTIVILTEAYIKTHIKLKQNDSIIFDKILTGNKSLGVAADIKINNNYDLYFEDKQDNISFVIRKKKLKKYKIIYINKFFYKEKGCKYNIIFSNTLRTFM